MMVAGTSVAGVLMSVIAFAAPHLQKGFGGEIARSAQAMLSRKSTQPIAATGDLSARSGPQKNEPSSSDCASARYRAPAGAERRRAQERSLMAGAALA
jgi:hypothetical protein